MSEAESAGGAQTPPPPFHMARIGRHVLVYGAWLLLNRAVSFLMLPIYTRYLTPADYGVMELVQLTLDVIAIAGGARIAIGIFRHYYKAETEHDRQSVVSTAFQVLAASYAAVGLATFLGAGLLSQLVFGSQAHTDLIRIAAGSVACTSFVITPFVYLRVRERSDLFVVAQAFKLFLQIGLNLLFLIVYELGVTAVFLSTLITNLVVGGALVTYLVRQVGLRFSRPALRGLLRYGLPLVPTQLATFVITFGDRYFLKIAADTTAVGLYALAYQFGFVLVALASAPFDLVWTPVRFEVAKRPDRDEIYARVFTLINLVLLTIALAISLFVEDLLHLMTTPGYFSAARFVPLILVAYVFQSWEWVLDVGIHVRERTEFVTLANWVATLVAVIGYAIFIPRYLAMGAAAVTAVAFALRAFLLYSISQRLWPVRYRWRPVWTLAALTLATALLGRSLPSTNLWISLGSKLLLLGIHAVLVWHAGVLSEHDRSRVRELARAALPVLRERWRAWRRSG